MPAIKPNEVSKTRAKHWPEAVFNVINDLIAGNWNGQSATFTLETLKTRLDEAGYHDKQFWDFEDIYEEAGWKVLFDKPGYNENYKAFYRLENR